MTPPRYRSTDEVAVKVSEELSEFWTKLRAVDLDTLETTWGVIEADTSKGWIRAIQFEEDGSPVYDNVQMNGGPPQLVLRTVVLRGDFRLERLVEV